VIGEAPEPAMPTGDLEPFPAVPGGLGGAAARFLDCLPALVLALLCLRTAELIAGVQTDPGLAQAALTAATAVGLDLVSLARYLPGLFLCSLPFFLIRSRRGSFYAIGLAWSLLVLVQAALVQYFLTARVPLGSDLFAYSWRDIQTTVAGGASLDAALAIGLALGLISLWSVLARQSRRVRPTCSPRAAAVVLGLGLLALVAAPKRLGDAASDSEDTRNLTFTKAAYFFDDSLAYLLPAPPSAPPGPVALAAQPPVDTAGSGFRYLDPQHPFLHSEQTPDALGSYFRIHPGKPPNLVFLIVEGLGRSFSGPDASLGSFTPQLDRLASESLYWENFLAVQGRTFAVLSSIFASLPFGDNGFAMLGERMPTHASLQSVLKRQGYHLKFYCGTDLDFDNERIFLRRQGTDVLVGKNDFGLPYLRANDWGYADDALLTLVLAAEIKGDRQPFVSVIQTMTMHTPYTFPGQPQFDARFEQRLDQLGVAQDRKDVYRAYRNIYSSILYTDDALGRFFEEAKKIPAYQNTVFILTGDHRLPEIPMATRIDRYHVPLIIFSPLLKAPARFKSVSSHFDLTPSLLAFLSHNYGVKTPSAVTWLGSGLDMEPSFRNIHAFPLKQTKTNLVDYVSGTWFLNQDTLYAMSDGMDIEPADDVVALAQVQAQFAAFRAANDQFARSLTLVPKEADGHLAAYRDEDRAMVPMRMASNAAMLAVREVSAPSDAQAGHLTIEVVFANTGRTATDTFVPLVVLLTEDGREVTESYGSPQRLAAGETISLQLSVKSLGVSRGRYFLSVLPSNPETGKNMGVGRYRIPIRFSG
jgi:uncharacterized sulfatase